MNVTIDLGNKGDSNILLQKLDNNELDILVTYDCHRKKYMVEPIFEERLIIALHKKMIGTKKLCHLALTRDEILTKSYSPDREIEDMSIFSDIEFLGFSRKSNTEQRMSKILGNYKSSRYKIENARSSVYMIIQFVF